MKQTNAAPARTLGFDRTTSAPLPKSTARRLRAADILRTSLLPTGHVPERRVQRQHPRL